MNEKLRPTGATRELPILRAALRRLDAGEHFAEFSDMRDELGLSVDDFAAGIRAL